MTVNLSSFCNFLQQLKLSSRSDRKYLPYNHLYYLMILTFFRRKAMHIIFCVVSVRYGVVQGNGRTDEAAVKRQALQI
ncbi:hypothetical protein [Mucilaginibacter ginsenosidivorans]|uniref:Uncharacterized protein n=1 Tax=Mucilaginibacter ginsenosidivorans TaxID=398053 RepID=A0A5B8UQ01_9SPHI|nr:hypothetical protein [Mucilaginibacter ginsenosidivorans]QEC61147.1 hypothetical protein FRZ54_00645 [Mucilaginibacter ginsenosidivorans]